MGTAATAFPVKDVVDETTFKDRLIGILAERIAQFPSQREASRKWKVAYPTINAIANGHTDALTFKQLCNIVWKSGATIQLGISYSS